MSKMLIKYSDNWADEMDIEGLFICSSDDWEAYKDSVKNYFKTNKAYTYCIGTNEEIVYSNANELLKAFEIVCSDIHYSDLGALEEFNILPVGFTGPDNFYIEEGDE